MDAKKNDHDVEVDGAGWGNKSRFICYTCRETCLRKPNMNDAVWRGLVEEFKKNHPSEGVSQ